MCSNGDQGATDGQTTVVNQDASSQAQRFTPIVRLMRNCEVYNVVLEAGRRETKGDLRSKAI